MKATAKKVFPRKAAAPRSPKSDILQISARSVKIT